MILPALDSATAYSPVWVQAVVVPQYGVRGEHATLYCKYSSVQPVYSVRWGEEWAIVGIDNPYAH